MADPTVDHLVHAQTLTRQRLTRTAVRATVGQVRRFDGWYSTAAITVFAERIAAQIETVQRQVAATTDAYLARVASLLTGHAVQPVGPVDITGLRRGVDHASVYGRLADTYRWRVSEGDSAATALAKVADRAESMADTDVSLAFREQAREFMVVREVSGYRRIVRPELSKDGPCGLCIAASDRIYHVNQLLPLHALCKCEVAPIINKKDPGRSLNAVDLQALYEAAGGTAAARLKRVRSVVREHGELGPVLTDASHQFRRVA